MNIMPTTIGKANKMGTKIVAYDTTQKKPVLIFKSIEQCIKYLFGHRIFKLSDVSPIRYLIMVKCCQQKEREDLNMFSKLFTYRYANDEQKELLDDQDYIVLDEEYRNVAYENKRNSTKGNGLVSYVLENILEAGDLVEINTGKLKGYQTNVIEVKEKSSKHTPGNFYYALNINGANHDFKANTLELIKKSK